MLEASSVTYRFGSTCAVDDLSLSIDHGDLFCLLGANGAGKTTTIQLFLGFLAPAEGSITVGGVAPAADPRAARAQLAYIPETVSLYPHLSGLENVELFCRMAGLRPGDLPLEKLLSEAGLTMEQARRPTSTYSKGMRQKVGLVIARARNAKALLLDEPLSGLDPAAATDFCDELARIREAGAAVLMTTHDIFRAKELGGRIGIMRSGRLVEVLDATAIDARDLERLYLHHMRTPSAERAAS